MIVRNLTYKGVSMSDTLSSTNKLVITAVEKDVALRTAIYERVNNHGANSSFTLASGRLFTIRGTIFGVTREERWDGQAVLNSIIVPETNPTTTNRGFYTLSWVDDNGTTMECQAKVYSMPKYSREIGVPTIDFTFELYSEEAYYANAVQNNSLGGYGLFGGASLPFSLPVSLDDTIGEFSVINNGNFGAPCEIQVLGAVTNPKISNLTLGTFYGVTYSTTNFVLNSETTPLIVTNDGVDISGYRATGSRALFIAPGTNSFLLTGDNYSPTSPVTITVTWKDTYISS